MAFFKQFPRVGYEIELDGVITNITNIFRYVKISSKFIDDANTYQFYKIHDGERPDVVSYKIYGTPEYYWTFFLVNDNLSKGMTGWPLSTQDFEEYMKDQYEGVTINGNYEIVYNSDGQVIDHRDSVAGRFTMGETVVGLRSGATGKVVSKNTRLNQISLVSVEGEFQENEIIRGEVSSDFITSYKVYDRDKAPKYLIDANGNDVTSAVFIKQATPETDFDIVTNREYEERLNDEHSKLRIIRPEYIQDFVNEYKRLVNL